MSEIIKRVARAMKRYRPDGCIDVEWWYILDTLNFEFVGDGFGDEDERDEQLQLLNARAAVEAIREPTKAMSDAGETQMGAEGAHDCEIAAADIWRAMIDAALRSETTEGESE